MLSPNSLTFSPLGTEVISSACLAAPKPFGRYYQIQVNLNSDVENSHSVYVFSQTALEHFLTPHKLHVGGPESLVYGSEKLSFRVKELLNFFHTLPTFKQKEIFNSISSSTANSFLEWQKERVKPVVDQALQNLLCGAASCNEKQFEELKINSAAYVYSEIYKNICAIAERVLLEYAEHLPLSDTPDQSVKKLNRPTTPHETVQKDTFLNGKKASNTKLPSYTAIFVTAAIVSVCALALFFNPAKAFQTTVFNKHEYIDFIRDLNPSVNSEALKILTYKDSFNVEAHQVDWNTVIKRLHRNKGLTFHSDKCRPIGSCKETWEKIEKAKDVLILSSGDLDEKIKSQEIFELKERDLASLFSQPDGYHSLFVSRCSEEETRRRLNLLSSQAVVHVITHFGLTKGSIWSLLSENQIEQALKMIDFLKMNGQREVLEGSEEYVHQLDGLLINVEKNLIKQRVAHLSDAQIQDLMFSAEDLLKNSILDAMQDQQRINFVKGLNLGKIEPSLIYKLNTDFKSYIHYFTPEQVVDFVELFGSLKAPLLNSLSENQIKEFINNNLNPRKITKSLYKYIFNNYYGLLSDEQKQLAQQNGLVK